MSYIYQLPNMGARHFSGNKVAAGVLDNWQFSGITHFQSGAPVLPANPTVNCVPTDPLTGLPYVGSPPNPNVCTNGFSGIDGGHGSPQQGNVGWYGTPDIALRENINWVKNTNFKGVGDQWYLPSSMSLPAYGNFGNYETPTLWGPGANTWDMTMFKSFKIGESKRLEFRFATFDTFNHANLGSSGAAFYNTPIFNYEIPENATHYNQGHGVLNNGNPAAGGQLGVISDKFGHREVEMALKLFF